MARSISLVVLGCAATGNRDGGATSGYVLSADDELTLIDCGGGVTGEFLRRGFDLTRVRRIIISHTHSDHVTELPLFLQSIYLTRVDTPLDLYLPDDFVEPFRNYLRSVYLFEEKFSFDLRITGYSPGVLVERPVKITAIANSHLTGNADLIAKLGLSNRMMSSSLLIESGKGKILYSGDLGSLDDIAEHLPGSTFAVLECTHIPVRELLAVVRRGEVGGLVLTHLSDSGVSEHIRADIEESGLNSVMVAEPGMVLTIEV